VRKTAFVLTLAFIALLTACSGGKNASESQPADQVAPAASNAASSGQLPADNEGVQLAKEILGLFDQAVDEAVGLVKDKPEAAELKPKLEALYKSYSERMAAINPRYLGLKDKDVRLFGAANTYLGENRGRHDFEKDNKFKDAYVYYNLEKGEKEIVDFLSHKLISIIDVATQH
jgi:hypothetical protein